MRLYFFLVVTILLLSDVSCFLIRKPLPVYSRVKMLDPSTPNTNNIAAANNIESTKNVDSMTIPPTHFKLPDEYNIPIRSFGNKFYSIVRAVVTNSMSGELVRDGKWFAGIAGIFSFIVLGVPPVITLLLQVSAFPLMVLGSFLLFGSIWQLNGNNSPYIQPCPNNQIVREGPYKHVRHPMYAGLILVSWALSFAAGSVDKLVLTAALTHLLVSTVL